MNLFTTASIRKSDVLSAITRRSKITLRSRKRTKRNNRKTQSLYKKSKRVRIKKALKKFNHFRSKVKQYSRTLRKIKLPQILSKLKVLPSHHLVGQRYKQMKITTWLFLRQEMHLAEKLRASKTLIPQWLRKVFLFVLKILEVKITKMTMPSKYQNNSGLK